MSGGILRIRAPHKVHVLSWVLALEKTGSVPCHFKNCKFMAISVEEMAHHYTYCKCEAVVLPHECDICHQRTDCPFKLMYHKIHCHSYNATSAELRNLTTFLSSNNKREITPTLRRAWQVFLENRRYLKCLQKTCLYVPDSIEEMENHYLFQCKEEFWKALILICETCNGRFFSEKKLNSHRRIAHNPLNERTRIVKPGVSEEVLMKEWANSIVNEKQAKCPVEQCKFVCNSISTLEKHYKFCTGEQKQCVTCTICNCWLQNEEKLIEHRKCIHKETELVICKAETLDDSFSTREPTNSVNMSEESVNLKEEEDDDFPIDVVSSSSTRSSLKKYVGANKPESNASKKLKPLVFDKNTDSIDWSSKLDVSCIQYTEDIVDKNSLTLDIVNVNSSVFGRMLNEESLEKRSKNQGTNIQKQRVSLTSIKQKSTKPIKPTPLEMVAHEMMEDSKNQTTVPVQIKIDNVNWTVNVPEKVVAPPPSKGNFPLDEDALLMSMRKQSLKLLEIVAKKSSVRSDVRKAFDFSQKRLAPFKISVKSDKEGSSHNSNNNEKCSRTEQQDIPNKTSQQNDSSVLIKAEELDVATTHSKESIDFIDVEQASLKSEKEKISNISICPSENITFEQEGSNQHCKDVHDNIVGFATDNGITFLINNDFEKEPLSTAVSSEKNIFNLEGPNKEYEGQNENKSMDDCDVFLSDDLGDDSDTAEVQSESNILNATDTGEEHKSKDGNNTSGSVCYENGHASVASIELGNESFSSSIPSEEFILKIEDTNEKDSSDEYIAFDSKSMDNAEVFIMSNVLENDSGSASVQSERNILNIENSKEEYKGKEGNTANSNESFKNGQAFLASDEFRNESFSSSKLSEGVIFKVEDTSGEGNTDDYIAFDSRSMDNSEVFITCNNVDNVAGSTALQSERNILNIKYSKKVYKDTVDNNTSSIESCKNGQALLGCDELGNEAFSSSVPSEGVTFKIEDTSAEDNADNYIPFNSKTIDKRRVLITSESGNCLNSSGVQLEENVLKIGDEEIKRIDKKIGNDNNRSSVTHNIFINPQKSSVAQQGRNAFKIKEPNRTKRNKELNVLSIGNNRDNYLDISTDNSNGFSGHSDSHNFPIENDNVTIKIEEGNDIDEVNNQQHKHSNHCVTNIFSDKNSQSSDLNSEVPLTNNVSQNAAPVKKDLKHRHICSKVENYIPTEQCILSSVEAASGSVKSCKQINSDFEENDDHKIKKNMNNEVHSEKIRAEESKTSKISILFASQCDNNYSNSNSCESQKQLSPISPSEGGGRERRTKRSMSFPSLSGQKCRQQASQEFFKGFTDEMVSNSAYQNFLSVCNKLFNSYASQKDHQKNLINENNGKKLSRDRSQSMVSLSSSDNSNKDYSCISNDISLIQDQIVRGNDSLIEENVDSTDADQSVLTEGSEARDLSNFQNSSDCTVPVPLNSCSLPGKKHFPSENKSAANNHVLSSKHKFCITPDKNHSPQLVKNAQETNSIEQKQSPLSNSQKPVSKNSFSNFLTSKMNDRINIYEELKSQEFSHHIKCSEAPLNCNRRGARRNSTESTITQIHQLFSDVEDYSSIEGELNEFFDGVVDSNFIPVFESSHNLLPQNFHSGESLTTSKVHNVKSSVKSIPIIKKYTNKKSLNKNNETLKLEPLIPTRDNVISILSTASSSMEQVNVGGTNSVPDDVSLAQGSSNFYNRLLKDQLVARCDSPHLIGEDSLYQYFTQETDQAEMEDVKGDDYHKNANISFSDIYCANIYEKSFLDAFPHTFTSTPMKRLFSKPQTSNNLKSGSTKLNDFSSSGGNVDINPKVVDLANAASLQNNQQGDHEHSPNTSNENFEVLVKENSEITFDSQSSSKSLKQLKTKLTLVRNSRRDRPPKGYYKKMSNYSDVSAAVASGDRLLASQLSKSSVKELSCHNKRLRAKSCDSDVLSSILPQGKRKRIESDSDICGIRVELDQDIVEDKSLDSTAKTVGLSKCLENNMNNNVPKKRGRSKKSQNEQSILAAQLNVDSDKSLGVLSSIEEIKHDHENFFGIKKQELNNAELIQEERKTLTPKEPKGTDHTVTSLNITSLSGSKYVLDPNESGVQSKKKILSIKSKPREQEVPDTSNHSDLKLIGKNLSPNEENQQPLFTEQEAALPKNLIIQDSKEVIDISSEPVCKRSIEECDLSSTSYPDIQIALSDQQIITPNNPTKQPAFSTEEVVPSNQRVMNETSEKGNTTSQNLTVPRLLSGKEEVAESQNQLDSQQTDTKHNVLCPVHSVSVATGQFGDPCQSNLPDPETEIPSGLTISRKRRRSINRGKKNDEIQLDFTQSNKNAASKISPSFERDESEAPSDDKEPPEIPVYSRKKGRTVKHLSPTKEIKNDNFILSANKEHDKRSLNIEPLSDPKDSDVLQVTRKGQLFDKSEFTDLYISNQNSPPMKRGKSENNHILTKESFQGSDSSNSNDNDFIISSASTGSVSDEDLSNTKKTEKSQFLKEIDDRKSPENKNTSSVVENEHEKKLNISSKSSQMILRENSMMTGSKLDSRLRSVNSIAKNSNSLPQKELCSTGIFGSTFSEVENNTENKSNSVGVESAETRRMRGRPNKHFKQTLIKRSFVSNISEMRDNEFKNSRLQSVVESIFPFNTSVMPIQSGKLRRSLSAPILILRKPEYNHFQFTNENNRINTSPKEQESPKEANTFFKKLTNSFETELTSENNSLPDLPNHECINPMMKSINTSFSVKRRTKSLSDLKMFNDSYVKMCPETFHFKECNVLLTERKSKVNVNAIVESMKTTLKGDNISEAFSLSPKNKIMSKKDLNSSHKSACKLGSGESLPNLESTNTSIVENCTPPKKRRGRPKKIVAGSEISKIESDNSNVSLRPENEQLSESTVHLLCQKGKDEEQMLVSNPSVSKQIHDSDSNTGTKTMLFESSATLTKRRGRPPKQKCLDISKHESENSHINLKSETLPIVENIVPLPKKEGKSEEILQVSLTVKPKQLFDDTCSDIEADKTLSLLPKQRGRPREIGKLVDSKIVSKQELESSNINVPPLPDQEGKSKEILQFSDTLVSKQSVGRSFSNLEAGESLVIESNTKFIKRRGESPRKKSVDVSEVVCKEDSDSSNINMGSQNTAVAGQIVPLTNQPRKDGEHLQVSDSLVFSPLHARSYSDFETGKSSLVDTTTPVQKRRGRPPKKSLDSTGIFVSKGSDNTHLESESKMQAEIRVPLANQEGESEKTLQSSDTLGSKKENNSLSDFEDGKTLFIESSNLVPKRRGRPPKKKFVDTTDQVCKQESASSSINLESLNAPATENVVLLPNEARKDEESMQVSDSIDSKHDNSYSDLETGKSSIIESSTPFQKRRGRPPKKSLDASGIFVSKGPENKDLKSECEMQAEIIVPLVNQEVKFEKTLQISGTLGPKKENNSLSEVEAQKTLFIESSNPVPKRRGRPPKKKFLDTTDEGCKQVSASSSTNLESQNMPVTENIALPSNEERKDVETLQVSNSVFSKQFHDSSYSDFETGKSSLIESSTPFQKRRGRPPRKNLDSSGILASKGSANTNLESESDIRAEIVVPLANQEVKPEKKLQSSDTLVIEKEDNNSLSSFRDEKTLLIEGSTPVPKRRGRPPKKKSLDTTDQVFKQISASSRLNLESQNLSPLPNQAGKPEESISNALISKQEIPSYSESNLSAGKNSVTENVTLLPKRRGRPPRKILDYCDSLTAIESENTHDFKLVNSYSQEISQNTLETSLNFQTSSILPKKRGRPKKNQGSLEILQVSCTSVDLSNISVLEDESQSFNISNDESISVPRKRSRPGSNSEMHSDERDVDMSLGNISDNIEYRIDNHPFPSQYKRRGRPPKNRRKEMMNSTITDFDQALQRRVGDESTPLGVGDDSELDPGEAKWRLLSGRIDAGTRLRNPNQLVRCAVCKEVMTAKFYKTVHLLRHNFMAWLEGEKPLPLDDMDSMVTILNRGKKRFPKHTFKCNVCNVVKKSALGFISHQQFCGKSELEREKMLVTCEICGRVLVPASVAPHMYQYHSKPKEMAALGDENPPAGDSRRPATRCLDKTDFGEGGGEGGVREKTDSVDYDDEEVDEMRELSLLYIPVKRKPSKNLKFMWMQSLSRGEIVQCQVPSCTFTSSNYEEIVKHVSTCSLAIKNYSCIKCNFISSSEDEMRDHVKVCNPPIALSRSDSSDNEDQDKSYLIPYLKTEEQKFSYCRSKSHFFKPALSWMRNLWATNSSIDPLYPEFHNPFDLWKGVSDEEIKNYNPNNKKSLKVSFAHLDWEEMSLLDGQVSEAGEALGFSGGPIWGLAWCPGEGEQFLATSPQHSMESNFQVGYTDTGPAVVHLWSLGNVNNSSESKIECMQFSFGICHEEKGAWELAWCPSGGRTNDRLGLLALASVSGSIPIFAVPQPSSLPLEKTRFFKLDPVIKLELYSNERWQCSAVSWSKLKPHRIVAAGFVNGIIAVWDLTTQSKLLRSHSNKVLHPFKIFQAHNSFITGICLSPESEDFLASSSFDKSFKFWDLRDTTAPQSITKRGLFTGIDWLRHWMMAVTSYDIAYTMSQTTVSLSSIREFMQPAMQVVTSINSTSWGVSANDWLNCLAASYDNGQAMVIFALKHVVTTHKDKKKYSKVVVQSSLEELPRNEEEACSSSATSSGENTGKGYLPLTGYDCASRKYGLKIKTDAAVKEFGRVDLLQENTSEGMIDVYPLNSINKIAWNPNEQSFCYLALGYQSGFLLVVKLSFPPVDQQVINLFTQKTENNDNS